MRSTKSWTITDLSCTRRLRCSRFVHTTNSPYSMISYSYLLAEIQSTVITKIFFKHWKGLDIKCNLKFHELPFTEGSVRHFLNRENIHLSEQTYQPEKTMDRAYLEEGVLTWYNKETLIDFWFHEYLKSSRTSNLRSHAFVF